MSAMSRATAAAALSLSLGALGACHHHGQRAESRSGDPQDEAHDQSLRGPKGETRSATRRISGARCERETRCNNVGADQKYATQDACEDQVRSEWANDLNAYECPNGVVEKELEECLAAIRAEDCNSPFDTLGRVAECTAGQICAN